MVDLSHWRGRHVLVTGATGFIGRHVVAQGRERGIEVYTTSRTLEGCHSEQCIQADLRDARQVSAMVERVQPEGILHLAAAGVVATGGDPGELIDVNAGGLARLLRATIEFGLTPSIVVAGSGFEYGAQDRPIVEDDTIDPASSYGVSKACATLVAAHFADRLPITLLRLFSVYGEGEREPRLIPYVINAARQNNPVRLTGCEQVRDSTYVGDVAEAFWRALAARDSKPGFHVFNVGTGEPVRLRVVVETLAGLLRERGLAPRLEFGALPYRSGEPMFYVADVGRLSAALNWRPDTGIEAGLRRVVESEL